MTKKKVALSLAAAVAALSVAGVVYAQVVPHGPSRTEVQERAAAQFDRMDANLDGQIDAADRAERQRAVFDAADSDSDGNLAFAEFTALRGQPGERMGFAGPGEDGERGRRGMRGERGGRGERMMGLVALLPMSDTNRDGAVTEAEYNAGVLGFFDRADTDDDGVLTREEAQAMRSTLRTQAQTRMRAARPAATGNAAAPPATAQ